MQIKRRPVQLRPLADLLTVILFIGFSSSSLNRESFNIFSVYLTLASVFITSSLKNSESYLTAPLRVSIIFRLPQH